MDDDDWETCGIDAPAYKFRWTHVIHHTLHTAHTFFCGLAEIVQAHHNYTIQREHFREDAAREIESLVNGAYSDSGL